MDTKKTPLAIAIFLSILSLICGLLIWILPDFAKALFQSWFHGVDLDLVWSPQNLGIVDILIGIVSAFISGYIFTWIFVKLYKAIVK